MQIIPSIGYRSGIFTRSRGTCTKSVDGGKLLLDKSPPMCEANRDVLRSEAGGGNADYQ